jgi:hypothetical protein
VAAAVAAAAAAPAAGQIPAVAAADTILSTLRSKITPENAAAVFASLVAISRTAIISGATAVGSVATRGRNYAGFLSTWVSEAVKKGTAPQTMLSIVLDAKTPNEKAFKNFTYETRFLDAIINNSREYGSIIVGGMSIVHYCEAMKKQGMAAFVAIHNWCMRQAELRDASMAEADYMRGGASRNVSRGSAKGQRIAAEIAAYKALVLMLAEIEKKNIMDTVFDTEYTALPAATRTVIKQESKTFLDKLLVLVATAPSSLDRTTSGVSYLAPRGVVGKTVTKVSSADALMISAQLQMAIDDIATLDEEEKARGLDKLLVTLSDILYIQQTGELPKFIKVSVGGSTYDIVPGLELAKQFMEEVRGGAPARLDPSTLGAKVRPLFDDLAAARPGYLVSAVQKLFNVLDVVSSPFAGMAPNAGRSSAAAAAAATAAGARMTNVPLPSSAAGTGLALPPAPAATAASGGAGASPHESWVDNGDGTVRFTSGPREGQTVFASEVGMAAPAAGGPSVNPFAASYVPPPDDSDENVGVSALLGLSAAPRSSKKPPKDTMDMRAARGMAAYKGTSASYNAAKAAQQRGQKSRDAAAAARRAEVIKGLGAEENANSGANASGEESDGSHEGGAYRRRRTHRRRTHKRKHARNHRVKASRRRVGKSRKAGRR